MDEQDTTPTEPTPLYEEPVEESIEEPEPEPEHPRTMGEIYGPDAASMAGLIMQIAADLRVKPELAFKIVETTVNYHLARFNLQLQQSAQNRSWMPPGAVDASSIREDMEPGDE